METLNINSLLNREDEANKIKEILKDFELNKHNLATKKGIYIYGEPGSGKSNFPEIQFITFCNGYVNKHPFQVFRIPDRI